jgi:hypothetical protein
MYSVIKKPQYGEGQGSDMGRSAIGRKHITTVYTFYSHTCIRGDQNAARARHWCVSREIPLIKIGFEQSKTFYLISFRKYILPVPS